MNKQNLRAEIVRTAQLFNSTALSMGTSGNLSAKTDEGFLITPSGIPYDELTEETVVEMNFEGDILNGEMEPSSEWRIHRGVFQSRTGINAIIHVHSPCATAVACNRVSIPAFHYEVAMAGGDTIPCAEYASFGTQELADNALAALTDRKACLLANHGQIALGESIRSAMRMARMIETLAKQYILSMQLGRPVLLDGEEMLLNVEKFKTYGKQGD